MGARMWKVTFEGSKVPPSWDLFDLLRGNFEDSNGMVYIELGEFERWLKEDLKPEEREKFMIQLLAIREELLEAEYNEMTYDIN